MKYETNMNTNSAFLRTLRWAVPFIQDLYIQNIHNPVIKAQYIMNLLHFGFQKPSHFIYSCPLTGLEDNIRWECAQMGLAKAVTVVCPFPPRRPVGPPGASESARVTT